MLAQGGYLLSGKLFQGEFDSLIVTMIQPPLVASCGGIVMDSLWSWGAPWFHPKVMVGRASATLRQLIMCSSKETSDHELGIAVVYYKD